MRVYKFSELEIGEKFVCTIEYATGLPSYTREFPYEGESLIVLQKLDDDRATACHDAGIIDGYSIHDKPACVKVLV